MSSKASSNAGKHPYRRSDTENLFDHLKKDNAPGINLNLVKPIYKLQRIDTEYFDKNKKPLFSGDEVTYKGDVYRIDYHSKEFYWILVNLKDPKNIEILKKTAKSCLFQRNG